MLSTDGTPLGNMPSNKPCRLISANIQGLYNMSAKHKVCMLSELAVEENAGIIALTESHLNSDIMDAEVEMPDFELFRSDRIGANRRGSMSLSKKRHE